MNPITMYHPAPYPGAYQYWKCVLCQVQYTITAFSVQCNICKRNICEKCYRQWNQRICPSCSHNRERNLNKPFCVIM